MSNRGGRGGGRGRGRGGRGAPAGPSEPFSPAPAARSDRPSIATTSAAPPPAPAPALPALVSEVQNKLIISPATTLPPSSSKDVRFPARPGFGKVGTKVQVKANHFLVEVKEKDLHHYDVTISPEVASKKVNRDIINELVKLYMESHMGKRMPAYDGMQSIYTSGALPFTSKEFVVKLPEREGRSGASAAKRRDREFKVSIKLASKPDMFQLLQFISKKSREAPQEIIQVLDVVLRAAPSQKYCVVGRSFFDPSLGDRGELGCGIEYWRGFYQSLRPTQFGLSLNIDVSARSFYEPILVTEFVMKYMGFNDLSKGLSERDCFKLKKNLKGVKVTLTCGGGRSYRITGVTLLPLSKLTFTLEDTQTKVFVVKYYSEKYGINLTQVALPALQSGNESRPAYLPMELCRIVPGQRYTCKLNERQVTNMLRATCQRPLVRQANIEKMVRKNNYNGERLVSNEFGIQVHEQMATVDARVLPPPLLKYHQATEAPKMGAWNMINKKMVNGAKIDHWAFVNFSRLRSDFNDCFLNDLINMCSSRGIEFNPMPLVPVQSAHPSKIEMTLRDIHKNSVQRLKDMGQTDKHLQLLIIILPDISGSYGPIKRICETELGIVSQCCNPKQAQKLSKQYLENLSLKINVKAGGRNTVLNDAFNKRIPLVSDRPTIIIGADVTHPQAGEDGGPSIAAVVASMDWPEISKYRGILSAQDHRQEIIQDLYKQTQDEKRGLVHSGMIRELFIAFRRSTGQKPHRIIFYRDGVSEGQFSQVLLYEMDAIRKACASLEEGYLPPITFIVVQKRHHTRFFPVDRNEDRSGNIQPGTVVDTKICHPTEFDFYLNSHAGIQGTSRPTHYHVLYDENRFNADQLQTLTNSLCYTYARCTRSVSIVPPAYYAHLAAFRARYYMEGDFSDSASAGRSSGGCAAQNQEKQVFRCYLLVVHVTLLAIRHLHHSGHQLVVCENPILMEWMLKVRTMSLLRIVSVKEEMEMSSVVENLVLEVLLANLMLSKSVRIMSIELLLAIIESTQDVVQIILAPLMKLGLASLLINLLNIEMSKLMSERAPERYPVRDVILRAIEALSVNDCYSQDICLNKELFQLVCDLLKFPNKVEVANSCVTAVVLVANILSDTPVLAAEL